MAIAPSKLGRLVGEGGRSDGELLQRLRELGLVNPTTSDSDLLETFRRAREEHLALSEEVRLFNSPHERVRVFLEPYLTDKGRKWAEPLNSLKLPDE